MDRLLRTIVDDASRLLNAQPVAPRGINPVAVSTIAKGRQKRTSVCDGEMR
jgi:hypothetical protein